MILRSQAIRTLLLTAGLTLLLAGCVDLPSEGHTPPDYKASIRVMYLDPTIASASIRVAPGPDFTVWTSDVFPSGAFNSMSAYRSIDAGDKLLYVPESADTDTSTQSFNTDQRGTLLVLPKSDPAQTRFLLLGEGRTFDPVGVTGSSRVKFVNAVTQSATDTLDVTVDVIQLPDSSAVATGLAFRAVSAQVLVDAGSSVSFYLARTGTVDPISGVVDVTGASNTDYTAVASGASDDVTFQKFSNQ